MADERKNKENQDLQKPKEQVNLKADIQGYRGGIRINLDKEMESGKTLRDELSQYLCSVLDVEIKNQESYVAKIPEWQNSYRGINPKKTSPWDDCANVSIPVIRSSVDTTFVRHIDNLFSKQKIVLINSKKEAYADFAQKIEDGFHWFLYNILKIKKKLMPSLMQAIKIGTGIGKIVYEEKKKVIYRYANENDGEEKKYSIPGTKSKVVKSTRSYYSGPNFYPIPREDWIQSADALDFEDCAVCGFRFYLRAAQVKLKARQKLFFKAAVDKLLGLSEVPVEGDWDEVKKQRAEQERQAIKNVDKNKPVPFYELWVKYDVDEDGEEDDISVTIHKDTGIILDAIYNPLFGSFRPFIKFIFYPIEFSRDGEGVCQILESIQNEVNTLHNQRLDRVTQINCPALFVTQGSGLEGLKYLTPGKVYIVETDISGALKEFRFSDVTVSSTNEEDRLLAMADRAVGLNPSVRGEPSSERPVAKETLALLEETHKKFKFGSDNIRDQMREFFFQLLEFLGQYQPTFKYFTKNEKGINQERTVDFPTESLRDIIDIQLATSSEMMSLEARREINLTIYQLLSDYMTKLAEMGQALTNPQVPSEFKKIILAANEKSVKILTKIIDDFPAGADPAAVVLDIAKVVDVDKCLEQSADIIAEKQAQQAPPEEVPPQAGGGQAMPEQGEPMPPQGMQAQPPNIPMGG